MAIENIFDLCPFSLCFSFFFGGGGRSSQFINMGYKGATPKNSNEEGGHHILQEVPVKSH